MKISALLRTAMANKGIKNATELANLSGVKYSTTIRAINDDNVSVNVVVQLLDYMGYELRAVVSAPTGGDL